VQATQIPGVAQRTGATTYYVEVMPGRGAALSSVLALNPAMGEVDVALATELLEAGRMIFNGFVTPDPHHPDRLDSSRAGDRRTHGDGRRQLRCRPAAARREGA
jgi:indolepyruvate ferredoxin oxidoreductase beta subunit